jgi:hypothetical protein
MVQANLKEGRDNALNVDYSYICPSNENPWQWLWNSCFHAIAIAHANPAQAALELETLIATQRDDGSIGHTHFWGAKFGGLRHVVGLGQSLPGEFLKGTALIQPPMLAQAVERVAQISNDSTLPFKFMARLDRYHEWLVFNRAPDEDGLLVIVSPDEAGATRSPTLDEALGFKSSPRRWRMGLKDTWIDVRNWLASYDSKKMMDNGQFLVKDALVNGVYSDSLSTMARMHREQGNSRSADAYDGLARKVTESMLEKLLDRGNGGFMSLVGRQERRVRPCTVGSLVPLVMPGIPQDIADELVERHIMRRDKFWMRYPIPSVAVNEDTFELRRQKMTWRGPTSVNTNSLVWRGLRRHGHEEVAGHLASRTVEMVAQEGLREFYNPLNGEGLGARSFGSSALALDMAIV